MRPLRVGTRGSALARRQAEIVCQAIRAAWPQAPLEVVALLTAGDVDRATPLHQWKTSDAFTGTLEAALLAGQVDLAVHSLKDLPVHQPEGLVVAAVVQREDAADALVAPSARRLADLPTGARVLSSSPRRRALLLERRADLRIEDLRGNVPTRLGRLASSGADAAVLACAGLIRLGLADRIAERLDPELFVPACGQGALAVEIRADDKEAADLAARIEDAAARAAVVAERAMLATLRAGCHAPVGGYARLGEGGRTLALTGAVAAPDGRRVVRHTVSTAWTGWPRTAETLGVDVAKALLAGGADEILDSVARASGP